MKFIFSTSVGLLAYNQTFMSATAEIRIPSRRRFRFARILLWFFLLVLCVAAGLAGYGYQLAHAALPQLDGQLQVNGLNARVTVTRDGHGVPTIEAATLADLFFAQGYVTAQDRLWQMDVMRRYGSGELSEILGAQTLKLDREQRVLGLRAAAKKSLALADSRDRAFFEAYARGVNAYIAAQGDRLPIEFRIMGYRPKPWAPEDSVVIANQMVKDLNYHYFYDALGREKILAKLGPELTADLYVNRSWHDRPPTVMRQDMSEPQKSPDDSDDDDDDDDGPDNSVTRATMPSGADFPTLHDLTMKHPAMQDPAVNGSNDWVISGAHTVTGKPLLSNDMHLGHQMPNLWYEAHLHSGTYEVAGVTLPGMPFVIVGHNQRVAWGFTNVGPTVTDVYIENFNAEGAYQTPSGWVQPEHRVEVIHVKGAPDVTVDVKITRHGPVISELVPGETRPLALRWTLYDGLRIPFFDVNSAQNWEDFRRPFAPRETATCRSAALTMRMSGSPTFRSTSCPASTIRLRGSSPLPMEESRPTIIPSQSAWSGKRHGVRRGFITCSNREENFPPPTCWCCKPMFIRKANSSRLSAWSTPWIMPPSHPRAPNKPPI